jgi:hypothetical protein
MVNVQKKPWHTMERDLIPMGLMWNIQKNLFWKEFLENVIKMETLLKPTCLEHAGITLDYNNNQIKTGEQKK